MFDIGWQELIVLGAVALVVFPPKEFPALLKTVISITSKVRATTQELQHHIHNFSKTHLQDISSDITAETAKARNLIHDSSQRIQKQIKNLEKRAEAAVKNPIAKKPSKKSPNTTTLKDKTTKTKTTSPKATAKTAAPKAIAKTASPKAVAKTASSKVPAKAASLKVTAKAASPEITVKATSAKAIAKTAAVKSKRKTSAPFSPSSSPPSSVKPSSSAT